MAEDPTLIAISATPPRSTLLRDLQPKPVIPLGLMPPAVVEDSGVNKTWVSISERLNNQNNGSVLYVALESEAMPSQEEVTELAFGLELSGAPFFWALRKPPGSNKSESVELPNGFEERPKVEG
ncbi:hypothetical protein ACSBR2_036585 [Camellia fascicularis]